MTPDSTSAALLYSSVESDVDTTPNSPVGQGTQRVWDFGAAAGTAVAAPTSIAAVPACIARRADLHRRRADLHRRRAGLHRRRAGLHARQAA